MYEDTLHRDEALAQQIREWDRSALLGPALRLDVRSDAHVTRYSAVHRMPEEGLEPPTRGL